MRELIKRLESATDGSLELDSQIGAAVHHFSTSEPLPAFTTSIDAALTLIPEGRGWSVCRVARGQYGATAQKPDGWNAEADFRGHSGPLALCIAALKARETSNEA